MTGYTVHTGSNENYSQGWDAIFRKGAGSAKKSAAKGTNKAPKKVATKKAAKHAGKKK